MTDQCDANVFKNGHSIGVLDACRHLAETFVQLVAKESGQKVDWHYSGGRANVLYLGDYLKVRLAFDKMSPLLLDTMPRKDGECGSCSGDRHLHGYVLSVFDEHKHGPYREGDPVAHIKNHIGA